MRMHWLIVDGGEYNGDLVGMDGEVAIVKCDDQKVRAVQLVHDEILLAKTALANGQSRLRMNCMKKKSYQVFEVPADVVVKAVLTERAVEPQHVPLVLDYERDYEKALDPDCLKGGEGSGNFGHEGRPGEIGGSGGGEGADKEADKTTESHSSFGKVRPGDVHRSLLAAGYKSKGSKDSGIGMRATNTHHYEHDDGHKASVVSSGSRVNFVNTHTNDPEEHERMANHFAKLKERSKSTDSELEKVDDKQEAVDSLTKEDEVEIEKALDPDCLKGGPGSGNFGHEGRPGEIGGSGGGSGSERQGGISAQRSAGGGSGPLHVSSGDEKPSPAGKTDERGRTAEHHKQVADHLRRLAKEHMGKAMNSMKDDDVVLHQSLASDYREMAQQHYAKSTELGYWNKSTDSELEKADDTNPVLKNVDASLV